MSDKVQTVLTTVKTLIETLALSTSEKSELLDELTNILAIANTSTSSGGQRMSNTISHVNIGNGNFNVTPNQSQGGSVKTTSSLSQDSSQNKQEVKEVMDALNQLFQAIDQDTQMNLFEKNGAKEQIKKLEIELNKHEPDKSLVGYLVTTLKKGLEGVLTLAEPTMKVATLVAKVWGLPTP